MLAGREGGKTRLSPQSRGRQQTLHPSLSSQSRRESPPRASGSEVWEAARDPPQRTPVRRARGDEREMGPARDGWLRGTDHSAGRDRTNRVTGHSACGRQSGTGLELDGWLHGTNGLAAARRRWRFLSKSLACCFCGDQSPLASASPTATASPSHRCHCHKRNAHCNLTEPCQVRTASRGTTFPPWHIANAAACQVVNYYFQTPEK